jgi:hypothetical protein
MPVALIAFSNSFLRQVPIKKILPIILPLGFNRKVIREIILTPASTTKISQPFV